MEPAPSADICTVLFMPVLLSPSGAHRGQSHSNHLGCSGTPLGTSWSLSPAASPPCTLLGTTSTTGQRRTTRNLQRPLTAVRRAHRSGGLGLSREGRHGANMCN